MRTFDQLARSAYEAYRKRANEVDDEGLAAHALQWDELDAATQQCWVAAATQVAAEIAAL